MEFLCPFVAAVVFVNVMREPILDYMWREPELLSGDGFPEQNVLRIVAGLLCRRYSIVNHHHGSPNILVVAGFDEADTVVDCPEYTAPKFFRYLRTIAVDNYVPLRWVVSVKQGEHMYKKFFLRKKNAEKYVHALLVRWAALDYAESTEHEETMNIVRRTKS